MQGPDEIRETPGEAVFNVVRTLSALFRARAKANPFALRGTAEIGLEFTSPNHLFAVSCGLLDRGKNSNSNVSIMLHALCSLFCMCSTVNFFSFMRVRAPL
jgi:hypothetical protein